MIQMITNFQNQKAYDHSIIVELGELDMGIYLEPILPVAGRNWLI